VTDPASQPALPAGITIRKADERDIPAIMCVVNVAFEEEAFFVNRPRTHPAQLAEHLRFGHFLLAHQDAELIASVYYELRGDRGYIGMLAVRPTEQRRGLGTAMMQAAEYTLREAGCSVVELSVVSLRTALPPIYRKLGYRETGFAEVPEELREKLTMPVRLIKMQKTLL